MKFFNQINKNLEEFIGKKYDKGLFLYGGGISACLTPGMNMGIQYKYGSKDISGIKYSVDSEQKPLSLARNNDFILSYWGLNLQYNKPVSSSMEFFSRASANLGTMEMIISQKERSMSFDDLYGSFDYGSSNSLNKSINYQTDLYIFEVFAGLRLFLRQGVSLDISSGYFYGITKDKGSINYEFDNIYNVPDFEFENMVYEISLSFGK